MAFVEPLETARRLLAAHGISTTYFSAANFTGESTRRVEDRINFDWDDESAIKGYGGRFSVRFSGLVAPQRDDTYIFRVRSEGGVRLWVDGKLLIDNFEDPGTPWRQSASIRLDGGKLYDLRLDHREQTGTGRIRLLWDTTSTTSRTIPRSRLYAYGRTFAVLGDYGEAGKPAADVARRLKKMNPHFIVTAGDNNYLSGEASTIDGNIGRYYHDHIGNYHGAFGDGADKNRFFPALGNHDYNADEGYGPYLDYFTLPGNERYYDFLRGPIHFFVLNSDANEPDGVSATSERAKWLKRELAESTAQWKFVVTPSLPLLLRRPPRVDEAAQWPFAEWGADAVLSGHDHLYERIHRDGVRYLISGLGGRQNRDGFADDPVAGSRKRFNGGYGLLFVSANDLAVTFQFITRKGKVIDSMTLRAG